MNKLNPASATEPLYLPTQLIVVDNFPTWAPGYRKALDSMGLPGQVVSRAEVAVDLIENTDELLGLISGALDGGWKDVAQVTIQKGVRPVVLFGGGLTLREQQKNPEIVALRRGDIRPTKSADMRMLVAAALRQSAS